MENNNIYINDYSIPQVVYETVSNKQKVDILIEDIRSERNIRIEIIQFFSIFHTYELLNKKRTKLVDKLSNTNDNKDRENILNQIEIVTKEEKAFRINILQTAYIFINTRKTNIIENAEKLFFNGEIFEAYNILNSKNLISNQEKIIELNDIYDKLEDNSNEFKIKAQLTILNLEIENIEDRYQKSINFFNFGKKSIEKTGYQNKIARYYVDFAEFSYRFKDYSLSEQLFKDAFEKFKSTLNIVRHISSLNFENISQIDLSGLARTIKGIADLHQIKGEFWNSFSYFEDLISIYEYLSEKDISFKFELANSYKVLGDWHRAMNEQGPSLKRYSYAIYLYKDLSNKEEYVNSVIEAYMDLGLSRAQYGYYNQAVEYYEEALKILDKQNDQNKFKPQKAELLERQSVLSIKQKEYEIAEEQLHKSLQIYQELYDTNPRQFMPKIALVKNKIGELCYETKDFANALHYFNSAISELAELAKFNSNVYLLEVALVSLNLSLLFTNVFSDGNTAIQYANTVLSIAKKYEVPEFKNTVEIGGVKVNLNPTKARITTYKEMAEKIINHWRN